MTHPRIYLTGHVAIEHGGTLIAEDALPGRQGRLAFVYLMSNRFRPVTRAEIAEVIWPDGAPSESDAALSAILSKLRAALRSAGLPEGTIDVRAGAIGVRLPPDTWVDVEAAANALDEAEGAARSGDTSHAWGAANVVISIAQRPFLADFDAPWIEARRGALRTMLRRGLECMASMSEAAGQAALAIDYLMQAVELEPFRESAYRRLMHLHAAMGNRAEALRVFERCRALLRDELGASPSPQTESVFLAILREGS